jgi:hypothetical protein
MHKKTQKLFLLVSLVLYFLSSRCTAEDEKRRATNLYLIDAPTANTLPKGTYAVLVKIYAPGGVTGRIFAGFYDRFFWRRV